MFSPRFQQAAQLVQWQWYATSSIVTQQSWYFHAWSGSWWRGGVVRGVLNTKTALAAGLQYTVTSFVEHRINTRPYLWRTCGTDVLDRPVFPASSSPSLASGRVIIAIEVPGDHKPSTHPAKKMRLHDGIGRSSGDWRAHSLTSTSFPSSDYTARWRSGVLFHNPQ
jgi:hypothetical protein